MKRRNLLLAGAAVLLSTSLLTGCGKDNTITIWVGDESVEFYTKLAQEFKEQNKDVKYNISVIGSDVGTNGGDLSRDNNACGDIVTIAHDNIGKLSRKGLIVPVKDEVLLQQIKDDNPASFVTAITNQYGSKATGEEYIFGAPYISQALFLYYNKKFVSDEQAKTFEGLHEAAVAANTKAFTVTGFDSYNYSFTMLARNEETKKTTTKIYENNDRYNSFFQGNDAIAATRWAQRQVADPNGFHLLSSSGWDVDLQGDKPSAVSVIGGAWHLKSVKSIFGEENVGCAKIPTFTLTDHDVEELTPNELDPNVPKAGDVYRGGTFADCKLFVINAASEKEKRGPIQKIMTFFSSKENQDRSFKECGNVPAYAGAEASIENMKNDIDPVTYAMANAQMAMNEYGIPQPFKTGIQNTYFYSKGCDSLLKNTIINEKKAFDTVRKIREVHYKIQNTWIYGEPGTVPSELPAKIEKK